MSNQQHPAAKERGLERLYMLQRRLLSCQHRDSVEAIHHLAVHGVFDPKRAVVNPRMLSSGGTNFEFARDAVLRLSQAKQHDSTRRRTGHQTYSSSIPPLISCERPRISRGPRDGQLRLFGLSVRMRRDE